MDILVKKTTSATFYGSIKLSELRAFMLACASLKDSATVQISTYRGDQRDGSSTTITVNDA